MKFGSKFTKKLLTKRKIPWLKYCDYDYQDEGTNPNKSVKTKISYELFLQLRNLETRIDKHSTVLLLIWV